MELVRPKVLRIGLVILLALVLSIPVLYVSNPIRDAAAAGSSLRIGFLQKVDSMNPYIGVSDAAYVFYGLVYDTLTCVDNDLNVTPNIALSYEPVPTTDPFMITNGMPYGSVWEYDLSTNASWSDGQPLTADDVVWNINLNAGNYTELWAFQPYAYFMNYAYKVDYNTVRIVFYDRGSGDPMPASYASLLSIYMLPRHKMQSMPAVDIGFRWTGVFQDETPPIVGTGPFVPTANIYNDWLAGNPITLVKNPDYHFGPDYGKYVNFDQIVLEFYDDTLAMQYALETGELDVAQFPPQTYYDVKSRVASGTLHNIQTFDGPKPTSYWIDILICDKPNSKNPSRLDPVIRHAMAMATNKTYIRDNFYLGLADIGTTMIAPINTRWHYEPTSNETWDYNLAVANALLESYGYIDTDSDGIRECTASSPAVLNNWVPQGTKLDYEMLLRAEYPEEKEIGQWLKSQWNQIGVNYNFIVVDEPTLNTIVYSYEYDMAIWYWSSDIDPNYQLFEATSMAVNGWNDIWYHSRAYDDNYTLSVKAMDYASRSVYVDNCQRIMYLDCNYIILTYPYQTYAWRTDTFTGWGDWRTDPGRSLDNFWSANPLLFDLAPGGYNVTGPTNLVLTADPSTTPADSPVSFIASAEHEFGYSIQFYIEYGDGASEVGESGVGYQWVVFSHAYDSPGIYSATVWAWDGLPGAEHNVSASVQVLVEGSIWGVDVPARTVDYVWYDMFNVPFGSWWDRRWSMMAVDQPWSRTYPYIFISHGAPPGNSRFYTNMRLNITGSGMTELNMNSRPEFLPYFGTERGGNAAIDWYMQYLTHDEIVSRIPLTASWDDGWFVDLKGTVTLDEQAAKAVLGISDGGFDNFAAWWTANNASMGMQYLDWIVAQSSGPLDIHPMYDYDLNFIDWVFWCEKVGSNVVIHMDSVSWGMEAMITRWMHDSFMPTEWYFEDMNFHMWIGPNETNTMIDTAVVYAAYAWENRTTGEPCWVWEGMLQDYVPSEPPMHPWSRLDAYMPYTYYNRAPGSAWYHQNMTYDYVPGAWNLSLGETLTLQWPMGQQLYLTHVSTGVVANHTGNMSVGYSEPWLTDFPSKVLLNPGGNTISFVGPIDMWDWSKNQTTHPDLASEWSRLGLQPYGIPWIEFQDVVRQGPYAAFEISPSSGNTETDFLFDASYSYDPIDPLGTIQYRWDFDSDGIWDTNWSANASVIHNYSATGYHTALLEVKNVTIGRTASTSRGVLVYPATAGHAPNALFSVTPSSGPVGIEFVVDASYSWDVEDPSSALLVRWLWDVDGVWTSFIPNKTATHVYDTIGEHTITLQVVDTSMLWQEVSTHVTVTDGDGPMTNISVDGTPGGSGWYVTNALFGLTAMDNWSYVDSIYYRIDGQAWTTFNGTLCNVSDGTHLVEFYSVDGFGNDGPVGSVTVKVDTAAPYLHGAIATGTMGEHGWYTSKVNVSFSHLSDNTSGIGVIRYREFGEAWQTYSGPFQLDWTGTIMFQVTASDLAGNQMATKEVILMIDPTAPIITVGNQATYNPGVVNISWAVSENISGLDRIETSIDGGAFQNRGLATSFGFTGLGEGQHTLIVRAIDKAGNIGEKTVTFTVESSVTPPSPSNALVYGLGAGVIVLAVIVLALFLLMRRRKGPPTAHEP